MKFKSEDYLPSRFHSIDEFYDFCMANDPEFDNASEIKEKWLNNRYQDTADEDGIKIWEKILKITPNKSDTLADRRFRVISCLQKRTPYTWSQLHKMMAALCGEDGYELKKGFFVLMVHIAMESQSQLRSVIQMLRDVVPMHILLEIIQQLYYNFNETIYSWKKNETDLTILPYQDRKFNNTVEANIYSYPRENAKVEILPYQKRRFNGELEEVISSASTQKKNIEILPYQQRGFKQVEKELICSCLIQHKILEILPLKS